MAAIGKQTVQSINVRSPDVEKTGWSVSGSIITTITASADIGRVQHHAGRVTEQETGSLRLTEECRQEMNTSRWRTVENNTTRYCARSSSGDGCCWLTDVAR